MALKFVSKSFRPAFYSFSPRTFVGIQQRSFHASLLNMVKVGDSIPKIPVIQDSPGNEFDIAKATSTGKSIIIGVPGAFSPACTAKHVPGYIKDADKFASKSIKDLYVIAVNDPFVIKAWGDSIGQPSTSSGLKIHYLADPTGAFTKAAGFDFDATPVFGGHRSKRYALYVKDGKIAKEFVESDPTQVDLSSADKVISEI